MCLELFQTPGYSRKLLCFPRSGPFLLFLAKSTCGRTALPQTRCHLQVMRAASPPHSLRKLQPSQTFSSSSLPRVHPLHAPRRYKLHSEVERNTLDLSDVPTARWDTMLSQQFALAEAPPIIPRARRGALGRRRPLWVQERDYCRRVSRRGFRQPDPKWRLADVLLA